MLWIILLLSITTTTGLIIENSWVSDYQDLWIPILLFVASYMIISILFGLILVIWSLFIDREKPVKNRKWIYDFAIQEAAKIVMFYGRISVHVSGRDKIPANSRFMMICNHRSMMDPLVSTAEFGKYKISFVSKSSNFKIPFVKKFMHKCCFISLDRDDLRDAVKMINQAVDLLDRNQASIAIYPEGTRNTSDSLLEFRNGAFKIALKAKVPVVVTTVRNTELVAKNFPFRRTHVYLNIVGVLQYEEIKDMQTKEIGDKVRKMMEEDLRKK